MALKMTGNIQPLVAIKTGTIVLGFVILVLGMQSHFESDWVKKASFSYAFPFPFLPRFIYLQKLHHICDDKGKNCPDISMEHYFISVIIITFVLSLCGMLALYHTNRNRQLWRQIDIGYHAVGALLLLVGAIVYIVSAEQIDNIQFRLGYYGDKMDRPTFPDLKRSEKLAAGSLTVLQAVLFGAVSVLIHKQKSTADVVA